MSCTATSNATTAIPYKNNLLQRFGGNSNYEMILISYCTSLANDPALEGVFGRYSGLDGMMELQRKTMDYAFADFGATPNPTRARDGALSRLSLHYFCLVEDRGLAREHLDRVIELFSEALREGWVEEDAVQEASQYLLALDVIYCGGTTGQPDAGFSQVVDRISDSLREELVVDAARHIQSMGAHEKANAHNKGGRRVIARLVQSFKKLRPSSVVASSA